MTFRCAVGDEGFPKPISLVRRDGLTFGVDELQTAAYNLVIWRWDTNAMPLLPDIGDNEVFPTRVRKLFNYEAGQKLIVEDEVCSVTSVDFSHKKITIGRGTPTVPHNRGAKMRHVIYESPTAVTWNPSLSRLELTLEAEFTRFPGVFFMEVDVDLSGQIASCRDSYPNCPFTLFIDRDGNGGV